MSEIRNDNNHPYTPPVGSRIYESPLLGLYDEITAIFEGAAPDGLIVPSSLQSERIVIVESVDSGIGNIAYDALAISSPELPLEIWGEIISYLHDEKEVAALACTNKTLYQTTLSVKQRELTQRLVDSTCAAYAFVRYREEWHKKGLLKENKACPVWAEEQVRLKDSLKERCLPSLIHLEQVQSITELYDSVRVVENGLTAKLNTARFGGASQNGWALVAAMTFSASSRAFLPFITKTFESNKIEVMSNCLRAAASYVQECKRLGSLGANNVGEVMHTWLNAYNGLMFESLDPSYKKILADYKKGIGDLAISIEEYTRIASRALSDLVVAELGSLASANKDLSAWMRIIAFKIPFGEVVLELISIAYRASADYVYKAGDANWYIYPFPMLAAKEMIQAGEFERAKGIIREQVVEGNYLEQSLDRLVGDWKHRSGQTVLEHLYLMQLTKFVHTLSEGEVSAEKLLGYKRKLNNFIYWQCSWLRSDYDQDPDLALPERLQLAQMLISAVPPCVEQQRHVEAIGSGSKHWIDPVDFAAIQPPY